MTSHGDQPGREGQRHARQVNDQAAVLRVSASVGSDATTTVMIGGSEGTDAVALAEAGGGPSVVIEVDGFGDVVGA